MSKPIIALILAVFIVGGSLLYSGTHQTPDQPYVAPTVDVTPAAQPATPPASATPLTSSVQSKSFTLADVSAHKNAKSCWTAVGNKVYDVTSWINRHPGGSAAILGMCGIDATQAFVDQHSGQRRPAQELASFMIGDLKN